jgi:uncharacterized membrane protein YeaQ/YmgE (transglycosylase-associated protein family)
MGFTTWIIAGALLGGAAGALTGIGDRRGFGLNVATGIAGVMSGGWLLGMLIGASAFEPGEFGLGSLLVSLLGAAALLAALYELRNGRHPYARTAMTNILGVGRELRPLVTAGLAGVMMLVGASSPAPPAPESAFDAARIAISNTGNAAAGGPQQLHSVALTIDDSAAAVGSP